MCSQYVYTPTPLKNISAALTEVFASMQDPDTTYTRSASTNLVIPVAAADSLDSLDTLIDALSFVHPSRFFVVLEDNKAKTTSAEISARCHIVAKKEHVCSEVVRLRAPRSQLSDLISLLRANFIVGTTTELFLYDSSIDPILLTKLIALSEEVIYDSSAFAENFGDLAGVIESAKRARLVDLQWIAIGAWRELLKTVGERVEVKEAFGDIKSVTIRSNAPSKATPPAAYLLAGWICDRLHLFSGNGKFALKNKHQQNVKLSFERSPTALPHGLEEVNLDLGQHGSIAMRRKQGLLLAQVGVSGRYEVRQPLEAVDLKACIEKHYVIGEATQNLPSATTAALNIYRSL